MSARLIDAEYTTEIPATVFVEFCVTEYRELKLKENSKPVKNSNSLSNVLLPFNRSQKPQLPARKSDLPQDFDLMNYGKKVSPKTLNKNLSESNLLKLHDHNHQYNLIDEELESATIQESPQSSEKPRYYSLSMVSTD